MNIDVNERLANDRGLARRIIGGTRCSDRTFYLVLAARRVCTARRELLAARSISGARKVELFASAWWWLASAQADCQRAE